MKIWGGMNFSSLAKNNFTQHKCLRTSDFLHILSPWGFFLGNHYTTVIAQGNTYRTSAPSFQSSAL